MTQRINLRTQRDLQPVVNSAVSALRAGQLVVLPTETVYGLGASLFHEAALEHLFRVKGRSPTNPLSVAISGLAMLEDLLPNLTELQTRLPRRVWPGPVTVVLPVEEQEFFVRQLPPAAKEAVYSNGRIGFRVPNHPLTLEILKQLDQPIVLTSANRSGQGESSDVDEIVEALGSDVDFILEDGPAKSTLPSTVVAIGENEVSILREGIVSRTAVDRLKAKIVIFVCTGNTCRSPMAEVLCRKLLATHFHCSMEEVENYGYVVMSAGVAAGDQFPASSSAQQIMSARGLSLNDHQSQPLNETHIRFADKIYAMTRNHRETILSLWPSADTRLFVLRTDGGDIADPYGGNLALYENCVDQIEDELIKRMSEIL
ncbi:MAG: L-threonylcarbamoyladenylate synthase [Planctomycetaceae bacterium]|nr:L-threonylcarbamoyladenylate synthase [Planctomycetaceae bacterium]